MLSPKLVQLTAKVLKVPEADLTPEVGIGDLDAWDSLGHLRLMMEIEHEYHIRFSTEQIHQLVSLAEIQTALPAEGKD